MKETNWPTTFQNNEKGELDNWHSLLKVAGADPWISLRLDYGNPKV